jgi:hypothetical protein
MFRVWNLGIHCVKKHNHYTAQEFKINLGLLGTMGSWKPLKLERSKKKRSKNRNKGLVSTWKKRTERSQRTTLNTNFNEGVGLAEKRTTEKQLASKKNDFKASSPPTPAGVLPHANMCIHEPLSCFKVCGHRATRRTRHRSERERENRGEASGAA